MIKIERKETEKTKQAIADLQKASETEGDYNTESVNQALKEIFHGKCYICENKAATSYQIEHLVPHRGDKTLKYDCFIRSGILWNNISNFKEYVREYQETEDKEEKEDIGYLLKKELRDSAAFAAFKRWLIWDNERFSEVNYPSHAVQ